MAEPYYITTAISYPNGKPHIGHAYEAIAADVMARFRRAQGRDVRFVTGTDEHGLKMVQTARAEGRDTLEYADEMSGYFRKMCDDLNISYDAFVRTTEPRHYEASVAIWKAMEAAGDLYLDRYEGWYSVRDEAFYDDSELVDGEGGEKLSPQGTPVEWTTEETWFFRLSKYQDRLLALYRDNPDFIRPESRRNEVIRFVEGGLRDLSVSRTSFDWGVPVPGSPDHVMYVWVDALTTYMTGVGYPEREGEYARFWPADVHLIGKDIVRFHAVYWPAFLMSANLPLPKQVFGHGFLLARGEKMSKSLGNVVDPMELAARFRRRPAALFPAARDQLRPGWQLQRRSDRQPRQQRARQQLRQPRPAQPVDDFQEFGWRSSGWRVRPRTTRHPASTRSAKAATRWRANSTASHSRRDSRRGWARCSPATPMSMPPRPGR